MISGTSALPSKADIRKEVAKRPLLTLSGQSMDYAVYRIFLRSWLRPAGKLAPDEAAKRVARGHGIEGSALDLQIKLVNDGYAAAYKSTETDALPAWANWRNEAFGFTYEPAVMIFNKALAPQLAEVTTRFELARHLTDDVGTLKNRVVTYDPERSGLGFLFGTHDAIQSEDFWCLARSLGDMGVDLETSSAAMINKVASGEALIAYNVLGSYAKARARDNPDLAITLPRDYCLVMSRIAVIARTARNPGAAGLFIDFLLSRDGQELIAGPATLYSLRTDIQGELTAATLHRDAQGPLIPINLGPGLLVYLDRLKRQGFLERWRRAMARE
jgi:ABC-type Fe3+ transport system substrate-binding protein